VNLYDLETAFYKRLALLTFSGSTFRPDQIVDNPTGAWRRGVIVMVDPETVGFGNGVLTRVNGLYQIDLYVPRVQDNAFKTLMQASDAHLAHFFPATGRGLALTEASTMASIRRRPMQRRMGREGAFLREIVDVEFEVYVPAVG
jgi:hypothetical protein